uniref:NADH dehydrogenase subunit 6 n=1 Tax=Rhinebothrium fulbrighti TaxID=1008294 RepID=A0A8K1SY65_9CEST|nr:NADH dehydrogenase subunit 6 [Rhinebothrium fulbrighti]
MFISLLFLFYFLTLTLFSLLSHPIYYCVLLVINSLISSLICYSVYGFSWYSLLFCLVYIGGVYILFVFVSVYTPNVSGVSFWSFVGYPVSLAFGGGVLGGGVCVCYLSLSVEASSYLCTLSEGWFYLCLCLVLLFAFFLLSLVISVKVNHYR